MSRHRGAKRPRRYELLGVISLLSPAYLLFVERWPVHEGPPDHYDRLSSLLDLSVSQSGRLMPLHSKQTVSDRPEPTIARLRYSLGGDRPSQTTRHAGSLAQFHGRRLDITNHQGGISHCGSTTSDDIASKPPTYATQIIHNTTAKLQ
jgi:hypothetical protein